ncbi:DNA-binding NarL/FixJ family response regulator [Microbacteriaceae bacterium SG_E_30_P1]|uniref:DNA-binding NarL/FixJ family response regulator n=1 Tax=Antiquaquibacter oligotrophicus TaxID=2880260 RepID=A0ABT6KQU4_9MICO|nr:response regulator transcription factor [Antiquaquibacter oligotrophicus]MDH6181853.1 DNA-binding NarL/FixJ family response regulator [Antiquaquibacter oligotrophicus]UDF12470.1 response regulator transcription factor [Antiquaquibacter oligotrophicus]
MIRVLVVDDDPLVRAGLRLLLGGESSDVSVVGEASDGDGLALAVTESRPDVVLLDVRMPRVDGITALRALLARPGPHPRVLMLTTFDTDDVVLDALRAGAAGFLLKHTPPERIVEAIRSAALGEAAVSPGVLRQLIDRATGGAAPTSSLDELTEREREVALAVADGLSNGEIAERLFLSVGSVKAHISSSLGKLGLDNRVQLAIAAHESRHR